MKPRLFQLFVAVYLALFVASAAQLQAQSKDEREHRKIHNFQHRTIPAYLFSSQTELLEQLLRGNFRPLRDIATKSISRPFASRIRTRVIAPGRAVLITFAPPTQGGQCFFAIAVQTNDGCAYHTLEKPDPADDRGTLDDANDTDKETAASAKAIYKIQTNRTSKRNGGMQNLGPRDYDHAEAFVEEFLKQTQGSTEETVRLPILNFNQD